MELRDQTVLVLGLGDSGLAMARWAVRSGATVRVWDSRENPPQLAALREQVPAAVFASGEIDLSGVQLVLKSPGLSPRDAKLQAVYASGLPVHGELALFAQALAQQKQERGYAPAVLAITGTNGKTTTTSMTALLAESAGKRVEMAGNIGPTLLDTLSAALDLEASDPMPVEEVEEVAHQPIVDAAEEPLPIAPPPPKAPVFKHLPEVWVLELSSFQLDGVIGFEPTAATVLNITQDHLDWHGDMTGYSSAKARVFGPDVGSLAVMVINRDDPLVEALVPAPVLVKQGRGKSAKAMGRAVVRFGLNAPRAPGDFGLIDEGGMAWLVRAMEADETIKRRKDEEEEEIIIQRLMPADALRVRGRHNAANALAALALASNAGCALAPMLHALREYRGEPHRVQHVNNIKGIDFYDDSKGTNVGATVAAISGLGTDREPAKLVLILGGDGKGQDFSPLKEGVMRHARAIALIGRDGPQIAAVLSGSGIPMESFDTLEAATRWSFTQAQGTDSVLLSPACASLDMFRNYAHRAEVFVDTVNEIANDEGLV
ncbi:MAG TPA: UDP-N-acetylmuramoyl-L-alanine--D-glutamate ligase [Burkholderiaceae bacterium]